MKNYTAITLLLTILLGACQTEKKQSGITIGEKTKVVSLNGTLTEILCTLGFEKNISGVDVTSTFPATLSKVPKLGHTRNMAAEGLISMKPDIVFAAEGELKPELLQQLSASGVQLIQFKTPVNAEESIQLIQKIADTLNVGDKAGDIIAGIKTELQKISVPQPTPKVLFIYARGAGMLMVAGEKTPIQGMIQLAGGDNAVSGFEDFKPLSTEILVKSNPDIILLFDSGLGSIGGPQGLLSIPGVAATNAGKNKAFIAMDGQFLNGFGPRTGAAALELNKAFLQLSSTPK